MGWFKVDDAIAENPKLNRVPYSARWLYLAGIAYSSRNGTDGVIDESCTSLVSDVTHLASCVNALVDVGLWHKIDGGYEIHDYLKYQVTRAKRDLMREASAERMRAHRSRTQRATKSARNAQLRASESELESYVSHPPTYAGATAPRTTTTDDDDDQSTSVTDTALDWLAQWDYLARIAVPDKPAIRDPDAWLAKARQRWADREGDRLRHLYAERPDLDALGLATLIHPPDQRGRTGTGDQAGPTDRQLADRARMQRGMQQMRAIMDEQIQTEPLEHIRRIRGRGGPGHPQ